MHLPTIEVTVTTAEDRDEMFAELFADGTQWGEVTLTPDSSTTVVKIFPPLHGVPYTFAIDALKAALDEAVMRLRKVEGR